MQSLYFGHAAQTLLMMFLILAGCSGGHIVEDEIRDSLAINEYSYATPSDEAFSEGFIEHSMQEEESSPSLDYSGLRINEVAAKGEPNDWVELYNQSSSVINLSGIMITDDLNSTPYVLEDSWGELPPHGFIVIEISEESVGFKLGSDEAIYLLSPDGVEIDAVDWTEGDSEQGMSLARERDGEGEFLTVDTPSPGASNEQ